jgi:hypothetical protein
VVAEPEVFGPEVVSEVEPEVVSVVGPEVFGPEVVSVVGPEVFAPVFVVVEPGVISVAEPQAAADIAAAFAVLVPVSVVVVEADSSGRPKSFAFPNID